MYISIFSSQKLCELCIRDHLCLVWDSILGLSVCWSVKRTMDKKKNVNVNKSNFFTDESLNIPIVNKIMDFVMAIDNVLLCIVSIILCEYTVC